MFKLVLKPEERPVPGRPPFYLQPGQLRPPVEHPPHLKVYPRLQEGVYPAPPPAFPRVVAREPVRQVFAELRVHRPRLQDGGDRLRHPEQVALVRLEGEDAFGNLWAVEVGEASVYLLEYGGEGPRRLVVPEDQQAVRQQVLSTAVWPDMVAGVD